LSSCLSSLGFSCPGLLLRFVLSRVVVVSCLCVVSSLSLPPLLSVWSVLLSCLGLVLSSSSSSSSSLSRLRFVPVKCSFVLCCVVFSPMTSFCLIHPCLLLFVCRVVLSCRLILWLACVVLYCLVLCCIVYCLVLSFLSCPCLVPVSSLVLSLSHVLFCVVWCTVLCCLFCLVPVSSLVLSLSCPCLTSYFVLYCVMSCVVFAVLFLSCPCLFLPCLCLVPVSRLVTVMQRQSFL
jgi:hypothetical protein